MSRVARLQRMSAAQLAKLFADPEASAPWVEAAAACGIPEAQVRLGRMLLEGKGIVQDQPAALRWFLKAARAGHADAQNMARALPRTGLGLRAGPVQRCRVVCPRRRIRRGVGRIQLCQHVVRRAWGRTGSRCRGGLLYPRGRARSRARDEPAGTLPGRRLGHGQGPAPLPRHGIASSAEAGYFRAQYNHAVELLRLGQAKKRRSG